MIPEPQVENQQPAPGSPSLVLPRAFAISAARLHALDAPGSEHVDPVYVTPDTSPLRRELSATRSDPPFNRLRLMKQTLCKAHRNNDD